MPPLLEKLKRFTPAIIRQWLRFMEWGYVGSKHLLAYNLEKGKPGEGTPPSLYEHVRMAIEELGPTAVKVGQIASTRPDLLPKELIAELSKLQENVPPFSFAEVRHQIRSTLGASIEDLFLEFNPVPIAAASIGQVYKAVLKSNEEVVVKVQRPGIRQKVAMDIGIMTFFATQAEKYAYQARDYNAIERAKEFGRFIGEEMDYTIEARYCDMFRNNFAADEAVYVPKIYWEYTNQTVLVMEFVHGVRVREMAKMEERGMDKVKIAKMIGRAYAKMILEDGFFHADPHPGNIFVLDDDHFALIDFGMVGRLDKETKGYIAHYFLALVNQDAPGLTEILFKLYDIPKGIDKAKLKRDVSHLMAKYHGVSLGKVNIVQLVGELMELVFKYHIKVPGEFTLFDKTFLTLDGIGKQLAPDFDLLEEALPFAQQFIKKQFSTEEMAPEMVKNALIAKDMVISLPRQINNIVTSLESGNFQVQVEQEGLQYEVKKISSQLDTLAGRMPLAMLAAGLVIAGAMLSAREHLKPVWLGYNAEQLCFYSATGIILWITWTTLAAKMPFIIRFSIQMVTLIVLGFNMALFIHSHVPAWLRHLIFFTIALLIVLLIRRIMTLFGKKGEKK